MGIRRQVGWSGHPRPFHGCFFLPTSRVKGEAAERRRQAPLTPRETATASSPACKAGMALQALEGLSFQQQATSRAGRSNPRLEPCVLRPRRPHHLTFGRACAPTMIPHARGRRARVGGAILLVGMSQPVKGAATAGPDPARRSRSDAPVAIRRAERRGDRERYAFNAAPSGMMPCTA